MLSPARTARLRPPMRPPGISTSIATSPEMNIIAPASERSSSPGWSETITAGAWPSRTVASTPRILSDGAKHLRVAERPQLLQALVLALADPLARDVERPPHLVECARMLAIQPVTELEHLALTLGEHAEHTAERRLPQLALGDLVGERLRLVGQKVSELGFLLVADRFLQREDRK